MHQKQESMKWSNILLDNVTLLKHAILEIYVKPSLSYLYTYVSIKFAGNR